MRRREFVAGLIFAAVPKAASAQQPASGQHRIAVVSPSVPVAEINEGATTTDLYPGFFSELSRLGYTEGRNLVIERRSAEGKPERYDEIMDDLINRKVELIVVSTARMAMALKRRTTTIPIVVVGAGLQGTGLVESLAHPGGNVTGFSVDAGLELYGKHMQLLRELLPSLKKVGFLAPRSEWESVIGKTIAAAATDIGIAITGPPVEVPLEADNYRTALTEMIQQGVDALLVSLAAENVGHAQKIVDFAGEHRLPAVYPLKRYAQYGGLMAYGSDLGEIGRGIARYSDQILKGTSPKDLPVQQPVKFEFIINLRTAKALGLIVPPTLLASADRVIE
jgi:putative tryptophan/tyrosine transport system substrate-binding protein